MARSTTGSIFNLQRFSTSDGPGIRSTVFLKGCPLHCPWCHNPEGINRRPEVIVVDGRCLDCGLCVETCPEHMAPGDLPALSACTLCGACAESCPSAARQLVGREWSVEEVMEAVLRDRIFYDGSGGGVTFSGGEPLSQPDFLIACLQACREQRLHCAIDTSGCAARATLLEAAELADLLLFDLKVMHESRHQQLLGAQLQPILANLEAVLRLDLPVWLRVPIVPGFTDDHQNLAAISELAASSPGLHRVCLLPYHRTAAAKHLRLNRDYDLHEVQPPSDDQMTMIAAHFEAAGLEVSIGR